MEQTNRSYVPSSLDGISSFDKAFLLLTGHYQLPFSSFDRSFVVLKKALGQWRDVVMWGPHAALLKKVIEQGRKEVLMPVLKEYRAAFDLSGDVSVSKKKIAALQALAKDRKLGKKMWLTMDKKIENILSQTISASLDYHSSKLKRQRVAKAPVPVKPATMTQAAWEALLLQSGLDNIEEFIESYPERFLHPTIERLVNIVETNPAMRLIDRGILEERIDKIMELGDSYFRSLSDVQAGRVWTRSALTLGSEQGVETYQVIAEMDEKTCEVCSRLHGKEFTLRPALDKLNDIIDSDATDAAELAAESPFPTVEDIDNMSREELMDVGFEPPFHDHCRCDIVLL